MSSRKRSFTVMIVPHSEESTYSFCLNLYVVQAVVLFLVAGVIGFCVLGYSYIKVSRVAVNVDELRDINRAQEEVINSLAYEADKLVEYISGIDEMVESFAHRLGVEVDSFVRDRSNNLSQLEHFVPSDSVGGWQQGYENTSSYYIGAVSGEDVLDRAENSMALLQDVVPERTDMLDVVGEYIVKAEAKPSLWPARGRMSSGFGMRPIPYARSGYQFHTGVDIVGAYGSPIVATGAGEILFSDYRSSFGHLIIIDHGYGFQTLYAHLSGYAVDVGDVVQKGQIIGYMGATGRTTGTHLHYEVHYNGYPVNPYNYMKKSHE